MPRYIDADTIIFHEIDEIGGEYKPYLGCSKEQIDNAPTVEVIPKDQYEARLKADMVAILTELQLEIEECVDGAEGSSQFEQGVTTARVQVVEIIQQKINALKGDTDATNGDIVKSLLTITDEWTAYNFAEDCKEVNIKADEKLGVSSFKKSWWDAPYGR